MAVVDSTLKMEVTNSAYAMDVAITFNPLPSVVEYSAVKMGGEFTAELFALIEKYKKRVKDMQPTFSVRMISFGQNKINVIKTLRIMDINLGLKEAKELIEKSPNAIIVKGVSHERALEIVKTFDQVNAIASSDNDYKPVEVVIE